MTESLTVIHYYRAKYFHMPGMYAIHIKVYTVTEIRNEGNPKFFVNRKRISNGQRQTAPNNTRASERQIVAYNIS